MWPLFSNLLLFYAILVGINIPAGVFGLEFPSDTKPRFWFQPPGAVIPVIWFILFTLLAIARYLLFQAGKPSFSWWLIALAVLCASYAYYTLGLSKLTSINALWFGLFGNLVVIIATVAVCTKLYPISPPACALTIPVGVWTLYATVIVVAEMRREGLV